MLKNYFEKFGHHCNLHLADPFDEYKVNKSRFRLWFMNNSTIAPKYILLRSRPRSFAKLRNEILGQLQNYPCTLHPFSSITFYCEVIWMVIVFIWLLIVPLDVFKNLNPELQRKPQYVHMLLASITIADVFRRFFTGYLIHRCDSEEIVLDLRKISFHYIKEFFLIDLVTSLTPFIELAVLMSPNNFLAVEMFSYLRIFRLASMLRIFKNLMNYFKINENVAEVLQGITIIWFLAHWISCFSILILIIEHRFDPSVFQWYSDVLTPDLSLVQKYIICFHRTVSILTGTGFKYFFENNNSINELIFTIFTAIVGHILTVIIFAKTYEIITGLRSASAKYEEMLNEVSQYMNHKGLEESTKNMIKTYYAYKYEHSYFSESFILIAIPVVLQHTILLHGAKILLENIHFFKKLPNQIAANIVSHFEREILLAGDVIFKIGDRNNTTYFLLHGTVAEFSESGRETLHVEDGSLFGEGVYIKEGETNTLSAVAIETCELYKLEPRYMLELVDYCPDVLELVSKQTNDRRNSNSTIDERYRQLKRRSLSLQEDKNVK